MNLQKLFEIQAELDAHIEKEHPRQEGEDRLAKKILALQVELGELANEWRGFKFWSKNQKPRTKIEHLCPRCEGKGEGYFSGEEYTGEKERCIDCDGAGKLGESNPLLEEYVDCLHFFLSVGIDLNMNKPRIYFNGDTNNLQTALALINRYVAEMWWENHDNTGYAPLKWFSAFRHFLHLGELLGFTEEQIEQAYLEKNKINHERQQNGY